MHPTLHVPSPLLGLVLLLVGGLWCWIWRKKTDPEERKAWPFGLVLGAAGLIAIVAMRTIPWPTYGFMMMLGCLAVTVFVIRWTAKRSLLSMERTLELLVLSGVCGLIGARCVFLVEQWDTYFADRPPILRTGNLGDVEPLAAGDRLELSVHGGPPVAVTFEGDERDLSAVRARILEQAGPQGVTARILFTQHRGDGELARVERGLLLETTRRGTGTSLVVTGGAAAFKLGPITGPTKGAAVPWSKVFDLSMGGLTYFGSVFGVLLSSFFYLRWRRVSYMEMLDVVAPALPLGLFFGRLGCLSRSCCFGLEIGEGSLFPGISFPAWSLPWRQMVDERLGCNMDVALAKGPPLARELEAQIGPLVQGTPPLHAAQLYEGLACVLIFGLVWAYRDHLRTKVGQAFAVLVLLQTPVRFTVEHFRRDLDVFWNPFGYLLTESQTVAILGFFAGLGFLIYVTKRGRPVLAAPTTTEAETSPETTPDADAASEAPATAVPS